ncbi:MAG TPA: S8 family serine peptidase [bacterium]|nr:S8 family serine peptidase [bacterium]
MRRSLAFLFLLGCAHLGWAQVPSLAGRERFVPGEVLVRFKEGVNDAQRAAILAAVGTPQHRLFPFFQKVELAPGSSVEDAVSRLKGMDGVLDAQPNYRYYALGSCPSLPSDVYDAGLTTAASWPYLKIQMDKAVTLFNGWTSCSPPSGTASVTVAVLDSGISRLHPDLRQVPMIGYNAICDTGGQSAPCSCGAAATESAGVTTTQDDFGHGTFVAGIIGADWNGNNAEGACPGGGFTTGVAGVAPGAVLMPIKVLDCTGSGTTEGVVAGTYYAVDHGARVLNYSLGSSAAGGLDPLEKEALDYALAQDCVLVASSGNESSPSGMAGVDFPAAYPPVLAVGASDPSDQRVFYSNGGASLDLLAPGGTGTAFLGDALNDSATKIFSSFLCPLSAAASQEGGFEPLAADGNFGVAAGTSASAPFVSGAAALIRSVYPSLDHRQVEQAIVNNTDDLNGGRGWDAGKGYGRLNVYRALLNAGTGTGQVTTYLKTFNSPNPFYTDSDGSTNITLAIDHAMPVDLSIYDTAGQLVLRKSFAAADLNQGPSRPQFKSFYIPWDGRNGAGHLVVTGVYFYFVTAGGSTGRNKIAVIRGTR